MKYNKLECLEKDKHNQFINSPLCKSKLGKEDIFSEDTLFLNCKLLSNDIVESEEDIMCDDNLEYNTEKYIEQFNKRITPLLVCFKPDIRDKILITNPKNRMAFTEKECEMDSGHPMRLTDQDTLEEIMTPSRMEIEYWEKVGEIPPFVEEIGMDWNKIVEDYYKLLEKEKDEKFIILDNQYKNIINNLTNDEISNFIENLAIPSQLIKIVYIDEKSSIPTFKFKDIPDMTPSTGGYVFDDISYENINDSVEEVNEMVE